MSINKIPVAHMYNKYISVWRTASGRPNRRWVSEYPYSDNPWIAKEEEDSRNRKKGQPSEENTASM